MKKLNKKGFTIVELVIVIAVIAILAAVLIPTYSSVVEKANKSNALQNAKHAYAALLVLKDGDIASDGKVDAYIVVYKDGKAEYYYQVKNGEFTECKDSEKPTTEGILKETEDNSARDGYWLKVSEGLNDVNGDEVKVYIYTAAASNNESSAGENNEGGSNP